MIIRQTKLCQHLTEIEEWFSISEQLHQNLDVEQLLGLLEKWALIKEQMLHYDNGYSKRRK
ncbi:MAG: hypothetical protein COW00_20170 [Bdellovibrio sp. CG12_big_fil_rev_8_21_14_0_65_39_13]|nr:MAG: hypothetical protein COW78_01735 [Bdellovibrio sp. CG22_combo_CG10-13_8_21_14_all_39_27]PIQ57546.1 MAG: hypothetical protein COW00_20170 [Bdellovibrio sp. CG12_big_fil_rev_8_21_14_0_65_39_13]